MAHVTALEQPLPPGPTHARRPQLLAVGVMIWLGSEFMFFSGLFAAFFTIRSHATVWPPPGTKLDTYQALAFTVVLLASSPTMQLGVWAQERGERAKARFWIVTSFVLGLAFLANQAYEWKTLPFRPRTNAYGSLFYIMSGLHGLHVLLGLVAMLALLGRMAGPRGDAGETPVFQAVSYYWHFVDIIWIGLFSALFLLS
ncbi:MAG TPA: heme-copper oxidase subunit III [Acidimicrobiales bacterium]|nr:heme-copper oxidase subunit III [Acidimicrobiales bacterium]